MKSLHAVVAAAVVALAPGYSPPASAAESIQLITNGLATPNPSNLPDNPEFTAWCQGMCFPTTGQPVYDPGNGQQKGSISVWGKNFQFGAGGSLCFSEYIVFHLSQGDVHVASGDKGTCGAPIDPVLKPPMHADKGATVVIAGGGDGIIVAGTGKYQNWTGTYTDRVFVGFGPATAGVGGIVYYDQLWFGISGK